jgi:hypothetical protein
MDEEEELPFSLISIAASMTSLVLATRNPKKKKA